MLLPFFFHRGVPCSGQRCFSFRTGSVGRKLKLGIPAVNSLTFFGINHYIKVSFCLGCLTDPGAIGPYDRSEPFIDEGMSRFGCAQGGTIFAYYMPVKMRALTCFSGESP